MRFLKLLMVLTGCAEENMTALMEADEASGAYDTGFDVGELPLLRADLQPTMATKGDLFLPQSFWLDQTGNWGNLDLQLRSSITIQGEIVGFAANPYGVQPMVPGQVGVPVEGRVVVGRLDEIVFSSTTTDDTGK